MTYPPSMVEWHKGGEGKTQRDLIAPLIQHGFYRLRFDRQDRERLFLCGRTPIRAIVKGMAQSHRTAEPIPFIRRFRVRTGFRIGTARGYAVPECDEQRWLIGGIATNSNDIVVASLSSGDCTKGNARPIDQTIIRTDDSTPRLWILLHDPFDHVHIRFKRADTFFQFLYVIEIVLMHIEIGRKRKACRALFMLLSNIISIYAVCKRELIAGIQDVMVPLSVHL